MKKYIYVIKGLQMLYGILESFRSLFRRFIYSVKMSQYITTLINDNEDASEAEFFTLLMEMR